MSSLIAAAIDVLWRMASGISPEPVARESIAAVFTPSVPMTGFSVRSAMSPTDGIVDRSRTVNAAVVSNPEPFASRPEAATCQYPARGT